MIVEIRNDYTLLLHILRVIKERISYTKRHVGICGNLKMSLKDLEEDIDNYTKLQNILKGLWENWEHFSGCLNLPVEGCIHTYNARYSKWDRRNKYGKLRHNLLEYLIDQLKEELGETL